MGEMHEMYGLSDDGEYNPMDGDIDEFSDACVSCGFVFVSPSPRLFCSELCAEEAKLIRYARRCRADGRIQDPDVEEAIDVQMALVLGGGYPRRERHLLPAIRSEINERDKGRCTICGEIGTEIDHISGSGSNPENLQLLCHRCHLEKTTASFRIVNPGDPGYEEINAKATSVMQRIEAQHPQRECDDPDAWPTRWKEILGQRRLYWRA